MRDKAELTDKADQLEHLVVQLQGETDTIGRRLLLHTGHFLDVYNKILSNYASEYWSGFIQVVESWKSHGIWKAWKSHGIVCCMLEIIEKS